METESLRKGTIAVVIFALIIAGAVFLAFKLQFATAAAITVPDDYPTIQGAIDHANVGDTIFVRSGTYSGPIVIDRSLSLEGEDEETAIIDGGSSEPYGSIVVVLANSVTISRFTIQHSRAGGNAIWIDGYNHTRISYNIIANNGDGIRILHSFGNTVENNLVKNNPYTAIGFNWAFDNVIQGNTIISNLIGIGGGFEPCYNNVFSENTIANNYKGIEIDYSDSKFFHNNIMTNTYQVVVYTSDFAISWDDGYPSGGNYWSDYAGQDSDGDGIGDTSYIINENNRDRYPFMQQNGWENQPPPPQVPEFPLGSAMPIAVIPLLFYLWWKRKQKTPP